MSSSANIKIVQFIYLAVSVLEIFAEYFQNNTIIYVTKPMLMPILMVWVGLTINKHKTNAIKLLFIALLFSFWGDVFMIFSEQKMYFLLGLGSFLITHLLYIFILKNNIQSFKKFPFFFAPIILTFIGLLFLIYPQAKDLILYISIYGLVIGILGGISGTKYFEHKTKSNWLIFLGVSLFITSDTLIAIDAFYFHHKLIQPLIMVLYLAGQHLITKGILNYLKASKTTTNPSI